jgi:hypothetical protein
MTVIVWLLILVPRFSSPIDAGLHRTQEKCVEIGRALAKGGGIGSIDSYSCVRTARYFELVK